MTLTAVPPDPGAQAEVRKYQSRAYVLTAVLILVLLAVGLSVLGLQISFGEDAPESLVSPNFPRGGPAEFLYLDSGRVAAYLAQIDGGSFSSEKQTHQLTQTLNGKVGIQDTVEVGGSKAKEDFVEREVTPTAASNFFALETALKRQKVLRRVHLSFFAAEVQNLHEGEFVFFKTRAMLSPVYTNSYLASRRRNALTAVFPGGDEPGLERKAQTERVASRSYLTRLGTDPRIVFSLHAKKPEQAVPFTYLLPLGARQLTEEQSLLKYGGGKFTAVGKLVRIFPEEGNDHEPAYVDSDTLRTWEAPLDRAPGELLCRTDPRCATTVREDDLHGSRRLAAIERSRTRDVRALRQQTAIEGRGAVIVPLAIYK